MSHLGHALVVGGGPTGLFAAESLVAQGFSVEIIEQRRSFGNKFLLAGRSGLNLTHSEPLDLLLARYQRGSCADIVRAAINQFPPDRLVGWAQHLGEPTIIGSSGRVFPESWRAAPLLRKWLIRLANSGVTFRNGVRFVGVDVQSTGERKVNVAVTTTGSGVEASGLIPADVVVLALGGTSWPRTGSDGAWQAALASHGVEIAPFTSANAGALVDWSQTMTNRFDGTPIKQVAVRSPGGEAIVGDVMITEKGLQGSPIYSLSSQINGPATLLVTLLPDLTVDELSARLDRGRKGDSLPTRLRKAGLSDSAVGLLMEFGARTLTATGASNLELAGLVQSLPVLVAGIEPVDRAISVAGGITSASIDSGFMLRNIPGVFVAGEMLDWDAPTGGYLLQACCSTGVAAAFGAFRWWSTLDD